MDTEQTDPGVALAELRAELGRLARLHEPADRDRLARELLTRTPAVLRAVRVHAAREAVTTMRAAEYARKISVTRAAVDHLLHRASTAARTRTHAVTIDDQQSTHS